MHNTDSGPEAGTVAAAVAAAAAAAAAASAPGGTTGGGGGGGMGRPTVGTVSGTTAGGGGGGAGSVGAGGGQGGPRECAGCGKAIRERYLLKALEMFWHEDCLKCGCCDCRLGEVGSTLYTKANLILCKRDYLRLFGTTGYCAACNKVIPAFEMVMRAKSNVYHLECFACQQCNHRFCVGDRFYLCDNKILCEYDYEERLVFANMACNPSSLAHIRRQVSNLQPGSNLSVGGADGSGFQHPLLMLQPPPAAALPSTLSKAHQLCDDKQLATNPHHQIGIPNHGRHFAVSGNHRHAGGGADDASSGYGSPDSDSLEVR